MFANVASAGMSGAIAQRANETTKALGGKASYLWATLAVFSGWRASEVELEVDDERRSGRMFDVVVANGRFFGGGMEICPEAEPDDGLLDVLTIGDVTKRDLATTMPKIYRGTHLPHPKAELLRGAVVTISSVDTLPIELDGEQPGTTPVRIDVLPRALRLRVPAAAGLGSGVSAARLRGGLLSALERRELLLELRDAPLELVDATHLPRQLVDPLPEVVERLQRLRPTGEVGEPVQRILAAGREPADHVGSAVFLRRHAPVIPRSPPAHTS